ncbi:MAG: hypothetical protein SFV53_03260 [Rickettsiales bacterium]|nr:hypothetical protein [Rickettsiales bacterium]
MKTKDRIKEEIGFEKLLMTIISAITSSLVSWLFNNIDAILSARFIIVFVTALIFLTSIIYFLLKTTKKIEELDYE